MLGGPFPLAEFKEAGQEGHEGRQGTQERGRERVKGQGPCRLDTGSRPGEGIRCLLFQGRKEVTKWRKEERSRRQACGQRWIPSLRLRQSRGGGVQPGSGALAPERRKQSMKRDRGKTVSTGSRDEASDMSKTKCMATPP